MVEQLKVLRPFVGRGRRRRRFLRLTEDDGDYDAEEGEEGGHVRHFEHLGVVLRRRVTVTHPANSAMIDLLVESCELVIPA